MLLHKATAPIAAVSKATEEAEHALFLRLEALARRAPLFLDCSVQQVADDEFVVVLSDHESKAPVCAWSGSVDGIVIEFEAWLEKKFPQCTVHASP